MCRAAICISSQFALRSIFTVSLYSQVWRGVAFLDGKATRTVALLHIPAVKMLSVRDSGLWRVDTQRSGKRDQVILLIDENGADGLAERVFV